MLVVGSHLPAGIGRLDPNSGLGVSLGVGTCGEYLGSSGGGGKKFGLDTITGVLGVTEAEPGELLGVTKKSSDTEGERLEDGETGTLGASSTGWVVGTIPLTGNLDIN